MDYPATARRRARSHAPHGPKIPPHSPPAPMSLKILHGGLRLVQPGVPPGPALRRYAAAHKDASLAACCDADAGRALDSENLRLRAALFGNRGDARLRKAGRRDPCRAAAGDLPCGRPGARAGSSSAAGKAPGMSRRSWSASSAAAAKGSTRAQVAFNRRFMPVMRHARLILDSEFRSGSPGRIDYSLLRSDRWDPDFSTTAIHALDAALFLAGSPFPRRGIPLSTPEAGGIVGHRRVSRGRCASGTRVSVNIQPVAGLNAEFAAVHAIGQTLNVRIPTSPQFPRRRLALRSGGPTSSPRPIRTAKATRWTGSVSAAKPRRFWTPSAPVRR